MKNNDLNNLKKRLAGSSFTTAFKATLGFYAAQAVISVSVLLLISIAIIVAVLISK